MCIAIPGRVLELRPGGKAMVEVAGRPREVRHHPIPDLAVGDWVLLYLGVAMEKVSEEEAREVLALWKELAEIDSSIGGTQEHYGSASVAQEVSG